MFVIYDLEYTSWPGAMANNWGAPGQAREIIQVGAVHVDADLGVKDARTWYVRPERNPHLSDFICELTGVSQDQVDSGRSLPQFYAEFATFCDGRPAVSYGNDMMILGENIGAFSGGLGEFPLGAMPAMVNIRPWINQVLPASRGLNSGRLWQVAAEPRPAAMHEHDALDDCYAIAAALRTCASVHPELLRFLANSHD